MKAEIKCSNWDYPNPNEFAFCGSFYLHGEAETINEFDCIEANVEAFRNIIGNHLFTADLLMSDSTKLDALVIPSFGRLNNKMIGLVVLCSDYDGLKDAIFEYLKHTDINTSIEHNEKEILYSKHPKIRKILYEYNLQK